MITIKHLEKKYNDKTILKDVNAIINKGDIISIIGPSGSGKSTLLRAIIMLDPPTNGEILYNDALIPQKGKELDEIRKKIGMVFQNFNLFNNKTIIENIMIPQMDLLGRSKQEAYDKAIELLKIVSLKDKAFRLPSELSGGQKQRVAICRTVAMEPDIILFDEPTSALDPTMVEEVQKVIKELAQTGKTMMIVTKEMKFAREVANRIFYMDEGIIYEEGTPDSIFDNPQKEKTRKFMGMLNVLDFNLSADSYDFYGIYSKIQDYGFRMKIPNRQLEQIQVIFEELCCCIIFEEKPNVNLNLQIKYSDASTSTAIKILYDGDGFNPEDSENAISFKLALHAANEYTYTHKNNDTFTNEINVLIK